MFSTLSYNVRLAKSKDIGGNQNKISRLLFWQLSFTSLGVIYGDIGTSPLYVLNSILSDAIGTDSNGNINIPSESDTIGAVSLIFWTLVILVCIKYIVFILMADNHGEGGTFALYALLRSKGDFGKRARAALAIFSMLGAAFVMGDGALTPAVSILSSVEGILIVKSDFTPYVVPITIVIVVILFFIQRFGTTKVGFSFSPIIVLWFLAILIVGIYNVTFAPRIFTALNPGEGVLFLVKYGYNGFICLGSVFLAVTGLEAMYADLGHFSANPIRLSWLGFAFPSLVFNYLGQGAYLLNNPSAVSNPFFNSVPSQAFWLLFVLSLLATIIASQAMITGTYSLVSQAIMLNFFPTVTIAHKSKKVYGQIYIPEINWILMVLTIAIVAGFGTSSTITHAYGVTVCSVMVETTVLYAFVIHRVWHRHWILSVLFGVVFLSIDSFFLAANFTKIPTGGYVSIIFAMFWFLTMLIWYVGEKKRAQFQKTLPKMSGKELRDVLSKNEVVVKTDPIWDAQIRRLSKESPNLDGRSHSSSSAGELVKIRQLATLEGTGIFFTTSRKGVPRSLMEVSKIISALPQVLVLMNLTLEKKPFVEDNQMITMKEYSPRLFRVKIKIGYMQTKLRMSTLLQMCYDQGLPQDNHVTIWTEDEAIFIKPQNFVVKFILTIYRFYRNIFKTSEIQVRLPPQSVFNVSMAEIL